MQGFAYASHARGDSLCGQGCGRCHQGGGLIPQANLGAVLTPRTDQDADEGLP